MVLNWLFWKILSLFSQSNFFNACSKSKHSSEVSGANVSKREITDFWSLIRWAVSIMRPDLLVHVVVENDGTMLPWHREGIVEGGHGVWPLTMSDCRVEVAWCCGAG